MFRESETWEHSVLKGMLSIPFPQGPGTHAEGRWEDCKSQGVWVTPSKQPSRYNRNDTYTNPQQQQQQPQGLPMFKPDRVLGTGSSP